MASMTWLLLGLLAHVAESATCYKADGNPQDTRFGWVPCNPDRASSPCCSSIDYCLDNGLCLNAGVVNNMYTVQGCTDPTWGGDCEKFCAGSIDGNGYVAITLCDSANNACCGDTNGACCSSPDKIFKLPFFTTLKHPGNPPNATEETSTVTTTMTVTQGLASQTGSPTLPPKGSASSDTSSADSQVAATTNSDRQAMKVGLGVGIPLGILLLAAVGYLVWELRKKRKAMAGGGPGDAIKTVYEADNGQTPAVLAHGIVPAVQPHVQSSAPKYEQYPGQQSFTSTELPSHVPNPGVAYQLPAELGRGELDGGYHAAR